MVWQYRMASDRPGGHGWKYFRRRRARKYESGNGLLCKRNGRVGKWHRQRIDIQRELVLRIIERHHGDGGSADESYVRHSVGVADGFACHCG